jgi:predicted dehydrogenase
MSSTATPRVGAIGLGAIGRLHIATWNALEVQPAALADAVPATLEAAIAEHGAEGFDDGIALITSGTVDIVSICTPPLFHRELAIAAAESGVAVLCEKPLARTAEDAEAIVEAVERTGTLFTVGFCHRFEPAIERLKAMIDGGELGDVMTFRNRFAGLKADAHTTWFGNPKLSGGGVMADTSVHSIDLFRHLVGDAVDIHAMTSTRETEHGPALQVEDTSLLTLKTAEGALGVIEASWRTPPGEWTVTIYGTRGEAEFDYGTGVLQVKRPGEPATEVEIEAGSRFEREFAHFIECWRGNADLRVTVRDGLAANRILDAAYASAAG